MWPLLPVTPFVRVMHRCTAANWYRAERSAATISSQVSAPQNLKNHSVQVLSPGTAASEARWVFFPQRRHLRGWGGLRRHRRACDRVHLQAALPSAARGRSHNEWQEVTSVREQKHHLSESLRATQSFKSGQERRRWQRVVVSWLNLCEEVIGKICKNAHHKILI